MGLSQWQRNEKAPIRSCVCRQSGSARWQGSGGAPHRATEEAAEQAFSIPLSSLLTDPPKFCFNLLGQTPTRGALFLCLFKTTTVIQRRLRSCDPKCFHLPDFSGSVWTARLKWKLERQVNEILWGKVLLSSTCPDLLRHSRTGKDGSVSKCLPLSILRILCLEPKNPHAKQSMVVWACNQTLEGGRGRAKPWSSMVS